MDQNQDVLSLVAPFLKHEDLANTFGVSKRLHTNLKRVLLYNRRQRKVSNAAKGIAFRRPRTPKVSVAVHTKKKIMYFWDLSEREFADLQRPFIVPGSDGRIALSDFPGCVRRHLKLGIGNIANDLTYVMTSKAEGNTPPVYVVTDTWIMGEAE